MFPVRPVRAEPTNRASTNAGAEQPRSSHLSEPEAIIRQDDLLDRNENLAAQLGRSVAKARELAKVDLDQDLFAALEWPRDLDGYRSYLERFVRWVPSNRMPEVGAPAVEYLGLEEAGSREETGAAHCHPIPS